jgi:hypothetical protein
MRISRSRTQYVSSRACIARAWGRVTSYVLVHHVLLGAAIAAPHEHVPAQSAIGRLRRELEALGKGVSAEEVDRAKAMCEAAVHSALEQPHIVAEDIGRQMITYGRRVPLDEFKQKVQVRAATSRTAPLLFEGVVRGGVAMSLCRVCIVVCSVSRDRVVVLRESNCCVVWNCYGCVAIPHRS